MTTVTRRIEWCSGHRLLDHEGKCAMMHGHQYTAYITAYPREKLDSIGRVIDFSILKGQLKPWIDEHWDHNFILNDHDLAGRDAINQFNKVSDAKAQVPYLMPYNPTAELIASHLLHKVCPTVFAEYPIIISKVVVWETPNCSAEVKV